jgi:hypothetical protein
MQKYNHLRLGVIVKKHILLTVVFIIQERDIIKQAGELRIRIEQYYRRL